MPPICHSLGCLSRMSRFDLRTLAKHQIKQNRHLTFVLFDIVALRLCKVTCGEKIVKQERNRSIPQLPV